MMKRIVLTFGLLEGAFLSIMMAATMPFADEIGYQYSMVIGYTTMVLAFLFVFFGIRSYRERSGGHLTFGRALKMGILMSAIASVCYVATWQVIYYNFMPDFADKYAAHMVDSQREAGASEAEIQQAVAKAERFQELYRNPLINIGFTLLEVFPVGIVMSLVAAGILRRRESDAHFTGGVPA